MLIEETLQQTKSPLSPGEIWERAVELHLDTKLGSKGKTPWDTIAARIYTDIKENGNNSKYILISKRPTRFNLRVQSQINILPTDIPQTEDASPAEKKEVFKERDLHPLLTKFVYSAPHFKCYTKTVYHEKSQKRKKGMNKWLHPDIVGVYYPFDDYEEKQLE